MKGGKGVHVSAPQTVLNGRSGAVMGVGGVHGGKKVGKSIQ